MATINVNYQGLSTTVQRVLDIFSIIAQPSAEKNESKKVKAIQQVLQDNKIESEYLKGAGLVVPSKEKPKLIIMSHYDLIPLFEKVFTKEDTVALKITEKGNIRGALDNTITNAVLIDIIINNPEFLNKTEIVFTEEEEIGCIGAANYMELKDYAKDAFVINLDVTNEGYEKYVSLEYDKPHWTVCRYIKQCVDENVVHWTINRVTDDLDSVIHAGGNGISICLPTKGIIHSMKNTTKVAHLEGYRIILKNIIEQLLNEKNFKLEGEFRYLDIEEALQCQDVNELKTKEESAKEEYTKRYSSYSSTSWAWEDDDSEENFRMYLPDYKDFKKYEKKDFIAKKFRKAIKAVSEEMYFYDYEEETSFEEILDFYKDTTSISLTALLERLPYADKSLEFITEIKNEVIKILDGMGSYFGLRPENLSNEEKKFLQAALAEGILVNVAPEIGEWRISIPFDEEYLKLLAMEYVY